MAETDDVLSGYRGPWGSWRRVSEVFGLLKKEKLDYFSAGLEQLSNGLILSSGTARVWGRYA